MSWIGVNRKTGAAFILWVLFWALFFIISVV